VRETHLLKKHSITLRSLRIHTIATADKKAHAALAILDGLTPHLGRALATALAAAELAREELAPLVQPRAEELGVEEAGGGGGVRRGRREGELGAHDARDLQPARAAAARRGHRLHPSTGLAELVVGGGGGGVRLDMEIKLK